MRSMRRSGNRGRWLMLGATAAVLPLAGTAEAHAAGTPLQVVSSPNVAASDYNELDAVATVGPSTAWAVGFARTTNPFRALVERWNGAAWTLVASAPRPAGDDTRLHGVAATGANDVWAVGGEASTSGGAHSLIEHWNGAAWSVIASPLGEPAGAELLAVTTVSPSNVWAVGDANGGGSFATLIEHWDGKAWRVVPGASILATNHDFLLGVAAASASDIWAVGRSFRHPTPIIEHWNGSSWRQVPQPVTRYDSSLTAVTVVNSNDVWAVGSQNLQETVTEHWDGTRWSLVPSPFPTNNNAQNILRGVVALGGGDVWAVGSTLLNFSQTQTLVEHWSGTGWSLVPSPNPSAGADQLAAVAGAGPGQPLWAVGSQTDTHGYRTLIVRTTG